MKVSLSDGEWTLMNCLWEQYPMTITQLTAALQEETGWTKHTIISMLSRLEGKGAVAYQEGARAKAYYPVLARVDASRSETRHFLNKVYGGSFGLLAQAMADAKALTKEDIEELSAILEQVKKEGDIHD